jgi:NAD(P)-dependent dehydrogenase (short-subunit alcohol dehydrogenase family)
MHNGYILVTGANRGIGAAIAQALAADGAQVAGLTRSGQTAAGEGFMCDVTDEAAIAKAVAAVAQRGPIAGLVNNAGLYEEKRSDELTAADFERLMRTNASSVVSVSREVYPHLKRMGGGLMVNIGSFFDKMGVARNLAYCASKAAVGAITRCLAVEWAPEGIRVVNVAPGYIVTDLNRDTLSKSEVQRWLQRRIPIARPGTPDEVAALVAMLFKSRIDFLTGETIYLDGGQSLHQ